jgi:hypothetical protein
MRAENKWIPRAITCGEIAEFCLLVIASAAKQSTHPLAAPWIASLTLAMTENDAKLALAPDD